MTITINSNNSSATDHSVSIPDAPALKTDATAKKVSKAVKKVRKHPPVQANALEVQKELDIATGLKNTEKLKIKQRLSHPCYKLVAEYRGVLAWQTSEEKQKNAEAINRYFQTLSSSDLDLILSHFGDAKMDMLLKNLLLLNEQLDGALEPAVKGLSDMLGIRALRNLRVKSKDGPLSLLNLLTETDGLCKRFPSIKPLLPASLQLLYDGCGTIYQELERGFDRVVSEKYSDIIQKYGPRYIFSQKAGILRTAFEHYLPAFWRVEAEELKSMLAAHQMKCTQAMQEEFPRALARGMKNEFDWLKDNIPHLQVPYMQMDDTHYNQGHGTCFQNSCDRQALLLAHPTIATKDIGLRSTQRGRFVRAQKSLQMATLSKSGNVYAPLGLEKTGEQVVVGNEGLRKLLERHSEPFILSLPNENHAINVQCNPKIGMFRFFDDNLGSFVFNNQEALINHLTRCLNVFYSDATKYRAYFTAPKPISTPKSA